MPKLCISEQGDHFELGGKDFFYFADTVWSAFTAPDLKEWEEYLDFRKRQGFNVLQINVLPQWDASEHTPEALPFRKTGEGEYDYSAIDGRYFDRACTFLRMARDRGFIPALVLLWCNYVPGTWASDGQRMKPMPFEAVRPYTEYVVRRFGAFDPIYIISGDTDFQSETSSRYYMEALKTVKAVSPEALTAMHIGGERSDLPEPFVESVDLDFYTYQSGHNAEGQHYAYHLAEAFYEKKVKRPVVNAEPCYEGHGYGNRYGRFTAFDVRRAVWQSLLSGASAGVAYGAHGVWGFHREDAPFPGISFSGLPFNYRDALRFVGAWDVGFAKWLFERYDLFGVEPQKLVLNDTEEIRLSMSRDKKKLALYIPYAAPVALDLDLSVYRLDWIELTGKRILTPRFEKTQSGGILQICPFNSDTVLIGTL